jgi:hypothetical protein
MVRVKGTCGLLIVFFQFSDEDKKEGSGIPDMISLICDMSGRGFFFFFFFFFFLIFIFLDNLMYE